ncbi:transposable element Tcb1 transposase [Trichonephila clavipes]|nr:transposable element Tcb1 transposase [Trichonephila clavipes]
MTGHIYRDFILEPHARLFRGAMGAEFQFIDDNARPHHANIVDECLQSEAITRKSVVVLDEIKQLQCGYVTVECRRVRRPEVVDHIHLNAPRQNPKDLLKKRRVRRHTVTSRTISQHIESVTHHSVYARNIRCRLQQSGLSARRPLLNLPLTQYHRRLRHQWCDERRMWAAEWNEVVFTDESRICLQHHDG